MRMGKRIAIALAAVVLISVVLVVAFAPPSHQEPRFIREMGKEVGDLPIMGRHFPPGTWRRTYDFDSDFETILQAMRRDLKSPEWVWGESTLITSGADGKDQEFEGWRVARGDESFGIHKDHLSLPGGARVEWYYVPHDPSWLETQWIAFREWISGRSGIGE